MNVTELALPGVKLIEPTYFEDFRGYYCESYSARTLHRLGIDDVFVQDNHFLSLQRGTIRGIHFQNDPAAQAKLIRCTRGSLFDVAVDLRKGSPTYKKWVSVILSAENRKQLYIPKGFGHICMALEDHTEGQYKVDALYAPELDRAIAWDDPEIGIQWPPIEAIVSSKDAAAPTLEKSDVNFVYAPSRSEQHEFDVHAMKRAVVTGASGFIGRALTKRLLADGWTVYAVVRDGTKLSELPGKLHIVECDFSHYECLAERIGEGIDWFLHFGWAGVSGPTSRSITAQGENIRAAAGAMEQAKRLGAKRFLFAGSSYQYRMEPVDDAFLAKNLYGAAKAAAGRLLWASSLQEGMSYNAVLFTNVYGVGDRSGRSTNTMLRKLLAGEPLKLISGEHLHDWTYIDDAVGGVLAVLEKGHAGKEYYVGARKLNTFRDIITRTRDAVSPETELRFGEYEDRSYIDYSRIDLDALYQDTGYECTADFEESIKKTAAWLSQEDEKAMKRRIDTAVPAGGVISSTYIIAAVHPAVPALCKGGAAWR